MTQKRHLWWSGSIYWEKQVHPVKRKEKFPHEIIKPLIKFMVSSGETQLLILQNTKCPLPSLHIKRIECSTLRRSCSSVWWLRHVNYGFIILWSERVTVRSLKILNVFKNDPQQRARIHPQLHNPDVLLVLFDLSTAVYSETRNFFPHLKEQRYPKAISESQHSCKYLF